MKIILLTGPGEVAKRQQALKIKSAFDPNSITEVDGKAVEDLTGQLVASPLFSEEKLVLVEDPSDSLDLSSLPTGDDLTTLLILATPAANSTLLKSAKALNAQITSFEGEREITAFPYLDNLIEGNKRAFVELDNLLKQFGGVYVLSMIYYLLRRNLLPPPKSDFMAKKIKDQRLKINDEDWARFYKMTLEAEYLIKSGALDEKQALTMLTQKFLS